MLQISLTLLVATFVVAVVRLVQVWKAEHALGPRQAIVVAHQRLAA
jgi:hypothetical protein